MLIKSNNSPFLSSGRADCFKGVTRIGRSKLRITPPRSLPYYISSFGVVTRSNVWWWPEKKRKKKQPWRDHCLLVVTLVRLRRESFGFCSWYIMRRNFVQVYSCWGTILDDKETNMYCIWRELYKWNIFQVLFFKL